MCESACSSQQTVQELLCMERRGVGEKLGNKTSLLRECISERERESVCISEKVLSVWAIIMASGCFFRQLKYLSKIQLISLRYIQT